MFSVEGSLGLVNRNIFCMSICLSDCLFVSLSRADHANNTVAINAYTNITIASYFHVQAVVPVVPVVPAILVKHYQQTLRHTFVNISPLTNISTTLST